MFILNKDILSSSWEHSTLLV